MNERKVLIVDDEFHIVSALSVKFRNCNYDVATASNGREALERIRDNRPDVVITDFQMPVMNGVELVKSLRSNPETRAIPIIMLTARGQEIEEEHGPAFNVDAFMSKPFSPREMVAKTASLIGGRPC